ncbi:MAG: hypothetical protein ACRELC_10840 [Gemmatimonadota bacterium]
MKRHLKLATLLFAAVGAVPVAAQDANLLLPPEEIERLLAHEEFQVLTMPPSRGVEGDRTWAPTVKFAEGAMMQIKWAPAARGGDAFNNRPRYEIAAYELQKLFLDPSEWVVPPTAARCFPTVVVQQLNPDAPIYQTFGEWPITLVALQYWLWNVEVIEEIDDDERLEDDTYARRAGNFNLLTYLINHSDSNVGNFLVSTDPNNPRLFSIDNGVAFASEESDRGTKWRDLRLERYPADTIERLRALGLEELQAALGVVAQFELSDDGGFRQVEPGENLDPGDGVRRTDRVLQLGLTNGEIERIHRRLQRLIEWVDEGKYELF